MMGRTGIQGQHTQTGMAIALGYKFQKKQMNAQTAKKMISWPEQLIRTGDTAEKSTSSSKDILYAADICMVYKRTRTAMEGKGFAVMINMTGSCIQQIQKKTLKNNES